MLWSVFWCFHCLQWTLITCLLSHEIQTSIIEIWEEKNFSTCHCRSFDCICFELNPNALLVYSNQLIPCKWFTCKTWLKLVLGAQSNHFIDANSFLWGVRTEKHLSWALLSSCWFKNESCIFFPHVSCINMPVFSSLWTSGVSWSWTLSQWCGGWGWL